MAIRLLAKFRTPTEAEDVAEAGMEELTQGPTSHRSRENAPLTSVAGAQDPVVVVTPVQLCARMAAGAWARHVGAPQHTQCAWAVERDMKRLGRAEAVSAQIQVWFRFLFSFILSYLNSLIIFKPSVLISNLLVSLTS